MKRARWSASGNRFYPVIPVEERFWSKVERGHPDECWRWLGAHGKNGRSLGFDGLVWTNAARVAMLVTSGRRLSRKELVCHKCDNPSCINPAHLYIGSYADNIRDAYARDRRKVRSMLGSKHPRAKLNEEQVKEMRLMRAAGFEYKSIGERFGVRPTTAFNVCKGLTWAHVKV